MSYVSEHNRSRFTGMSAALVINGSIILAVALSPLVVEPRDPRPIMIGRNIPDEPLAPPPAQDEEVAMPIAPIFVPNPIVDTIKTPIDPVSITDRPQDTAMLIDGAIGEDISESIRETIVAPIPPFTAATRDPRYLRHFQPEYPLRMLQREIEGSVTVRILVGTDGRVRQTQVLNATDPDFGRATERHAMKSWRFTPAKRGDEPVEDWLVLTVRFDIT